MFLHSLLQEEGESLLFKVLNSQIEEPIRHDWINQIYKDIQDVGIIFSLEEIQRLSEGNFNAHVKLCIRRRALEWLNSEKKSKFEGVEHSELRLQNYLLPNILGNKQKKLLFLLRSRMIDVKVKFSEKCINNKLFKICKEKSESQEHVLKCKEILKQRNILVNGDIDYNHIFDKEVEKQANVTILFEKLWKLRNKIIKENDIQN